MTIDHSKIHGGFGSAVRRNNGHIVDVNIFPVVCVGFSAAVAQSTALGLTLKRYPPSEGWSEHQAELTTSNPETAV